VADGLKTAQCEGGTQPAGWKGRDGTLWFPTASGVASILPGRIRKNEVPPPVLIEHVSAGGRALDLGHPARLGAGAQELAFQYTALSFLAPEKVRFRYKLEGADQNWIEAGTRRVASYNKIPPGDYRFRVMACNNDGVWNETGSAFAFSLAPFFYQTYWFYALGALAVGVAGWSFHRHRMSRAQAQFSLVLAERNRIARDLHDTLAQGFAGIAFQLEAVATRLTEAPAQAQQHLNLALNMVRHSLGEARRSVMNLRSAALENGDLAKALTETARQLSGHKPVDISVQTIGAVRPLPPTIESNLLRIGQEAITNSLKHGLASRIEIELSYLPRTILMRIRDDGKGFEFPSPSRTNGAHFGLLGMQERAKQMGARLDLKSSPSHGATVEVEAPTP
jgi:signal transduction histidine kinase